jgi:hypothetical protein
MYIGKDKEKSSAPGIKFIYIVYFVTKWLALFYSRLTVASDFSCIKCENPWGTFCMKWSS